MTTMTYPYTLRRDSSGTFLVSFRDLPWVHTFGESEDDARVQAADALMTALVYLVKERQPIPMPTARRGEAVTLPATVAAKVGLHNALLTAGITRAELARRLDMHRPQVDRLFDLDHASTLGQIEMAARELGARLEVMVLAAR